MTKVVINLLAFIALIIIFSPAAQHTARAAVFSNPIHLGLPLSPGHDTATDVKDYIGQLFNYARLAASVLAILMIIYGGIRYSLSQGNADQVAQAKEIIFSAISGLFILIFASLFLQILIGNNFNR